MSSCEYRKILARAFSIERLRCLLLCLLKREEEESVEQRSKEKPRKNFSNEKRN